MMTVNSKVTIEKLLFQETGTYNDPTTRSYRTEVDYDNMRALQQVTNNGTTITPNTVAGVAGTILRPAAEYEGLVSVTNGWQTQRFRFMMVVRIDTGLGNSIRQIVTGYTDHAEVSFQNTLDPNMRLFINGATKIAEAMVNTPVGNQYYGRPIENYQLLTGTYAPNFGGGLVSQSMRPEDVFCSMSKSMLMGGTVHDYRTAFPEVFKKSKRANNLAPQYLSDTLTAYRTAMDEMGNESSDLGEIMNQARGVVREAPLAQDVFLNALSKATSFGEETWFTYGDLLATSPDLDNRVVVSRLGQTHRSDVHWAGQSEYWTSSTQETVIATILSQSVPAMMFDLSIPKLAFSATNHTMDGQFDIKILGHHSWVEGVDLTPNLMRFMDRLRNELLRDLSRNNQIGIAIIVRADVMGDISVNIALNGQAAVDYNTAVFCDALFAPVVTHQPNALDMMASDIGNLADTLTADYCTPVQPGEMTYAVGSSI